MKPGSGLGGDSPINFFSTYLRIERPVADHSLTRALSWLHLGSHERRLLFKVWNFRSLREGSGLTVGFPKAPAGTLGPAVDSVVDPLATFVIARPALPGLSSRELEVLQQVASGLSDKQVAGQLGISQKTVRNHLTSVYGKLRAGNRVEAVINALRSGLLSL